MPINRRDFGRTTASLAPFVTGQLTSAQAPETASQAPGRTAAPAERFDYVIAGAGHNSLVCAAYLDKARNRKSSTRPRRATVDRWRRKDRRSPPPGLQTGPLLERAQRHQSESDAARQRNPVSRVRLRSHRPGRRGPHSMSMATSVTGMTACVTCHQERRASTACRTYHVWPAT